MIDFIKGGMKGFNPCIHEWDAPKHRIYKGKKVFGRPTRAFGTKTFGYAGKSYHPDEWTVPMKYIKGNLENLILKKYDRKVDFKFCLCGLYKSDGKGIPHHSDTVPTEDDLVVSVSFGAPRVLEWIEYKQDIKNHSNTSEIDTKYKSKKETKFYLLEDGDIMVFNGKSQIRSTHAILDVEPPIWERINLTFRTGIG
tara:strand:- start:7887 stop:8474 length:588 start_codon:yes stop_codon:yes gene_type:complete